MTSNLVRDRIARDTSVTLDPVERNIETLGTAMQKRPDSRYGKDIGGGAGTGGQDLKGVLAIRKKHSRGKRVDGKNFEQDLKAKADGKDFTQIVRAMTERKSTAPEPVGPGLGEAEPSV